jgi:type I restriction-modification system DNA methylase subunit
MLCRIHDERQTPRNSAYEFQTRQEENAEALRDRMELLFKKAAENLGIAPQVHFRAISATALQACIKELQSISFTRSAHSSQPDVQTDVLGDFFEKTLSSTFKQSKGQFFTHKIIADFVTRLAGVAVLVSAKKLPTVIDPTSGSGTFLIEALAQMEAGLKALLADRDAPLTDPKRHQLKQSLTPTQPDQKPARGWANGCLYGMDSNEDMSFVCKLNLLMHGADPGQIFHGSSLMPFNRDQIKEGSFDFVLTNPPFSVKLSTAELNSLEDRDFTLAKPQTAKRSEHVFLEVWHRLLRPGGCFSAVVPEAMLDVPLYKNARIKLLELFWVDAVIALPKSTFMPYTGTKTVVLRATKKSDSEISEWAQAVNDAKGRSKTDEECFKYAFELTAKNRHVFLAEPEQVGYARSQKGEKVTGSDLVGDRSVLGCWQERAYDHDDRRYDHDDRRYGFWIKLSDVTVRETLRLDPKHHWLWTVNAGRIDPTYEGQVQPLRALVTRMKPTYVTASKVTTDSRDSPIGVSGDDAIMSVDSAQNSDTDEGRVQVDVETGEGFPFVNETHMAALDAKRLEFGASDIALFSISPFKVLRNQVAKRWIGRYTNPSTSHLQTF